MRFKVRHFSAFRVAGTSLMLFFGSIVSTLYAQHINGGQEPVYRVLTISDGLPSNEVYCMKQGPSGNMWIGTDKGLVKYNGSNFRTWTIANGLPGNSILKMHWDYKDRLWCSTFRNGVFYIENDSVKIPPFNSTLKELKLYRWHSYVHCFWVDSLDNIMLGFKKQVPGYLETNLRDSNIFLHQINAGLGKQDFYHILNGKKVVLEGMVSNTWPFTGKEKMITGDSSKAHGILRLIHLDTTTVISAGSILDESGNLRYTFINDRIYDENDTNPLMRIGPLIYGAYWDGNDIFLATFKGIYHFGNGKIGSENLRQVYSPNVACSRILRDSEGVFWVSTIGNGVLTTPSFKTRRVSMQPEFKQPSFFGLVYLKNDTLNMIYKDQLVLYDIKNSDDPYFRKKLPLASNKKPVGQWLDNGNFTLLNNKHRNGKPYPQVFHYSTPFNRKVLLTYEQIYPLSNFLKGFKTSVSGDTIYLFKTKGFDLYKNGILYYSSKGEFEEDVQCLHWSAREKKLWLGTSNGLYYRTEGHYKYLGDQYPQLKAPISHINQGPGGHLFVSTMGQGLVIIHKDSINTIDQQQGLSSNFVGSTQVSDSLIWVKTGTGLAVLGKQGTRNYRLKYLLGKPFTGVDIVDEMLMNNNMPVVVSRNQLISLEPAVIKYPFGNTVRLESFFVNDTLVPNISYGSVSELANTENNIRVNFILESLHQNDNTIYEYRLKGYLDHWIRSEKSEVRFAKLPPGEYTFEVRGRDILGRWGDARTLVSFAIAPHYSNTLWFKSIVLLLLMISGYWVYRFRKRKIEQERVLLTSNINFLKSQISPHFIFNGINSIRYLISSDKKWKAEQFVSKFSNLIRTVVYTIDHKRVPLCEELNRVKDYIELEQLRYESSFDWKITLAEGVEPERLFIPPMLLQPLVENAIRHGLSGMKKGKLHIKVETIRENLTISITDNGPGLDVSKIQGIDPSKSVGLKNVLERVRLISRFEKKRITLEIKNKEGTLIVLMIQQ